MIYKKRGITARMPQFLDKYFKISFYNQIPSN